MRYPIVKSLGFDLIWFNVVMLINMELALITPPVGMNLFVIKGISPDSTIGQIIQGSVPFAIIMALEIVRKIVAEQADEAVLTDGKVDYDKLQPIIFDIATMT